MCAFISDAAPEPEQPDILTHLTDSGQTVIVAPPGVLKLLEYNVPQATPAPRHTSTCFRALIYRERSCTEAKNTAQKLAQEVRRRFPEYRDNVSVQTNGGAYVRVLVGRFDTHAEAEAAAKKLRSALPKANMSSAQRHTYTR